MEARAAAQTSMVPQQIGGAVTHPEFGTISLIFQYDTAGLSASMTSADPGFARAAQSAIVAGPAIVAGLGACYRGNGRHGHRSVRQPATQRQGKASKALSDALHQLYDAARRSVPDCVLRFKHAIAIRQDFIEISRALVGTQRAS